MRRGASRGRRRRSAASAATCSSATSATGRSMPTRNCRTGSSSIEGHSARVTAGSSRSTGSGRCSSATARLLGRAASCSSPPARTTSQAGCSARSRLVDRAVGGGGERRPRPYHGCVLRSLRISNLVLIQEAEIELDSGLNAITGETGAGKTILTNAIGLLLGARGDAALIGAAGEEAYVEAEFDGADDELLGALAELRPDGEDGVVLARRIFADGRTRAYAWGRSAAREDVASAAEALIAMSGQFEQRRLAKPAYQRGVLDTFAGIETRRAGRAWRDLQAARRAHDELTRDAAAAQARLEELRALAADTEGLDP